MPWVHRTCKHCGMEFGFMETPSLVRRGEGKFCSSSCSSIFNRTGKPSNNWQGGRTRHGAYIKVYRPDHPNARPSGYILEHRLVMSVKLERPLERTEVVHHINGNTTDNRQDNLELLSGQSDHMKKHSRGNKWVSV